jgi:hypothetical protein
MFGSEATSPDCAPNPENESLDPADEAQARTLLKLFECDRVLDRPQPIP